MFAALNIVVILMVLLIAYWWATQGLFSAILHLVCVVAAATIALALWEPLVVGLLLRGGGFDNYAWGLGLGALFTFSLLIFRVTVPVPGSRLAGWYPNGASIDCMNPALMTNMPAVSTPEMAPTGKPKARFAHWGMCTFAPTDLSEMILRISRLIVKSRPSPNPQA